MAFGKKKVTMTGVDQSNVAMLASKALAEKRSNRLQLAFRVTGETPVLMNQWSQKAVMQMVAKMVGMEQPRPPKDLTEEFESSAYRNVKGELVMPCRIVKACIVEGAISTGGVVSKAELKRSLRVLGYTAPIRTKEDLQMDVRIASNNGGTPDVRSRAVVSPGYHFDVVLQFTSDLTPDKIIASFEAAGATIGLCDWRQAKGGDYGAFSIEVLQDKEIARILKECSFPEKTYQIPPEMLRAFRATPAKTDMHGKVKALVNGRGRTNRDDEASAE